jgi:parallel beta-helix repeat protein
MLAMLVVAVAVPALAGEGRKPLWQPIVINPGQEGKYIVTRDIQANPGMPIVDIQPGVVSVDIDLNGFTLYGMDTDIIRARGVDNLTVRNGMLSGGTADGIHVEDSRKVVIEDVKAQVQGGVGFALLEVATTTLRRNILFASGSAGILIDGQFLDPMRKVEGTIEDNQLFECGDGIIVLNGDSYAVLNNRVEITLNGDGIRANTCDACLIAENTVKKAMAMGIVLDEGRVCKLYNNVVHGSGAEGIALLVSTQDCLVLNNLSSENAANGFVTDGMRNHIDQNVFNFNGQAGVWFTPNATDNTIGRNTLRANQVAPGPCAFTPAPCFWPDYCDDGINNTSFGDNMGPGPGC